MGEYVQSKTVYDYTTAATTKLINMLHVPIKTQLPRTQCTFQHYVPCVDLLWISLLGIFIHAPLSHAYLFRQLGFLVT